MVDVGTRGRLEKFSTNTVSVRFNQLELRILRRTYSNDGNYVNRHMCMNLHGKP